MADSAMFRPTIRRFVEQAEKYVRGKHLELVLPDTPKGMSDLDRDHVHVSFPGDRLTMLSFLRRGNHVSVRIPILAVNPRYGLTSAIQLSNELDVLVEIANSVTKSLAESGFIIGDWDWDDLDALAEIIAERLASV